MEKKFRKGEIVWAKVRGFPWWPALVRALNVSTRRDEEAGEVRELTAVVYFVGDDTHSELPLNKIEKFASRLEEYSRTKKKTLLTSILIAKKILAGEIPFEKHLQYARNRNLKEEVERKELEAEVRIEEESVSLGKKRRLSRKESDTPEKATRSGVVVVGAAVVVVVVVGAAVVVVVAQEFPPFLTNDLLAEYA